MATGGCRDVPAPCATGPLGPPGLRDTRPSAKFLGPPMRCRAPEARGSKRAARPAPWPRPPMLRLYPELPGGQWILKAWALR